MRIYRYKIPFVKPVNTGSTIIYFREGLILECTSPSGSYFHGEAAPLTGLSGESSDEVENYCLRLAAHYDYLKWQNCSAEELLNELDVPLCSSLLYALESVLIGMGSKKAPVLNAHSECDVKTASLVAKADDIVKIGSSTVKMKAGRSSLEDDISLYNLIDSIESVRHIRVDPNRSWSYEDSVKFISKINREKIEFVEEPFENIELFSKFYSATGVSVAIDESLGELESKGQLFNESTGAVVIKPVVSGGISKTLELIESCKFRGVKPVISSVYEAGPGFEVLKRIARCCSDDIYHGLGTRQYLAAEIYRSETGYSIISSGPGAGEENRENFIKRVF